MRTLLTRLLAFSFLAQPGCPAPPDGADSDDSGDDPDDDDDSAACTDDAFEENDALNASLSLLPNGYGDLVACPGDADWYTFEALVGERVGAEVLVDPGGGTLLVTLWDAYGTVLASGETSGGPVEASALAPDDDNYFLEIRLQDAGMPQTPYALTVLDPSR